ncbi:aminotransferase class III-fold pyridoxal phosphate-dependent enzyme [Bacteroides pyogenes]|uniref:aminotransferase class III-fold pyridoxal phosphate-dependent enzyme n=1 Tax=Bacteroides pyogenes TaxID=310300 RepID=UPI003B42DD7F
MGKGQDLYKKAKTMIPGGTSLLSKRPEQLLPENWPAYYSKSKGCHVWDLDGKEYIDCSMMGIGTNVLGYANEAVDEAVMKVVRDGNLTTLNCPEEVYLAENLLQMNPWAGGVRYTRGGGEANSMCVRIARAFSGKDKVAICGYHGWHDWYVSVNLGESDALAGHLLPGIPTGGVPKGLRGTAIPFHYNDYEELLGIVDTNPDLAAVKMEVCRNFGPEDNFLQKIRNLCTERGIILIFDECTSGFRETFGGLFMKYGVEPDMTIYSKTMANGYALSTVVGRKEIMEAAQGSWISSTFWTERIGPTAALAALAEMERTKSWEKITMIGLENKKRWQALADKYGLKINQWGIPALAGYTFDSPNALAYKTYTTQEMLKQGYLAGNSLYPCIAHTPEILDDYFSKLDKIFADIRDFEDGRDVMKALDGPVCQGGFKRLN